MALSSENPNSYERMVTEVIDPVIKCRKHSPQDFSPLLSGVADIVRAEKQDLCLYGNGFNPFGQLPIVMSSNSILIPHRSMLKFDGLLLML